MFGMNAALNPPPVALTDEAMKLCATILAVASDPAGTKSRLDELNAATTTLRAEIDGHAAAKKSADDASHAGAAREDSLNAREQALDRRENGIEARAKALDDRLEAYRKALA